MERKISFAPDEYYHIYARGNDRRKIFIDYNDSLRFLVLLYVANNPEVIHLSDHKSREISELFTLPRRVSLVDIGAYCLMPNHFHLLVKSRDESGVSNFMLKLMTAYSMYFNKKNTRTGALFEKPFKAERASDDEYLRYLFAYIHLNPVKITDPESWAGKRIAEPEKAKKFLSDYRFSSYHSYLGENRPEDVVLEKSVFPEYFQTNREFSEFISDWVTFENDQ